MLALKLSGGQCRRGDSNPSSPPCDPRRLHRYSDAGLDERSEARPVRPEPVAADQDRRDVRSSEGWRREFAGRGRLPAEAVSRRPGRRDAARDPRYLLTRFCPIAILKFFRCPLETESGFANFLVATLT